MWQSDVQSNCVERNETHIGGNKTLKYDLLPDKEHNRGKYFYREGLLYFSTLATKDSGSFHVFVL